MGSEPIGHEAEGQMDYWLKSHEGKVNNNVLVLNPTSCSKKYRDTTFFTS